ncbi:MAG: hypothetical protein KC619_35075 [Myxococcales bacterium]|nr:hypothetical protein [Myxococcales bacterium]
MITSVTIWGLAVGVAHVIATGAYYGNPLVDRVYARAMEEEPGVKRWTSKPRYLATQIAGTQVEVFILTAAFLWLRPQIHVAGFLGTALLGLVFAGVRVYPRFWNMWIQSTYPNRLLAIEVGGGLLSTAVVVTVLHFVV